MMIRKPVGGNPLFPTAISLSTREELDAFATQFAAEVQGGDIVALIGPMGSGKTTLTQSLCKALGIIEPVTSPTFGLFHQYALPNGMTLLHGDLYRLTSAELEVLMPEFDDQIFNKNTITLLEWADLYPALESFWTWRFDFSFDASHPEARSLMVHHVH